jgi:Fuc2NAc and GlcNAc transferase
VVFAEQVEMISGWTSIAAFLAACVSTAWLRHHLRKGQLMDQPNSRSSHTAPTPRGGGLSIVAVTTCGAIALYATGAMSLPLVMVLVLGGLSVAAIGFWDDIRAVPIIVRMSVHIVAAVFAVDCLSSASLLHVGGFVVDLGRFAPVIAVVAIVWILNLFNFMDGIDGIAASEGAFMLLGFAGLALFVGHGSALDVAPALIAGAACLGFLVWNWAPASIFMGDVGSGYLGYVIAVIAIDSSKGSPIGIYAWLILGGVFVVDSTLTLFRRLFRGEPILQAHRIHAYQWLSRRWGSHSAVTFTVIAVDLVWLLPCAALAVKQPAHAPWICFVALAPVALCALLSGAGRPE